MKTDTVLLCYRGGFLGWLLVNAVISVPRFLWAGVGWVASYEAELYWWFLASGWFFVVAAHYTISSLWLDRHAESIADLPLCTNDLHAMPCLTVWLTVHYLIVICTHDFASRRWPTLYNTAWHLLYLIAVPVVLVWTRNTTALFALAGAGFGAASGLLFAATLLVVWLPALEDLNAAVRDAKAYVLALFSLCKNR
jgi:hypothetical protein